MVIGERPDLLLAHDLSATPPDQLAAVGIKAMIVNVCCDNYATQHGGHVGFDAIYRDIALMGKLLGTESYAAKSVARQEKTVADVQQQAKSLPMQSVAVVGAVESGQFFTYGASSIANTQIQTLGLTNAFGDLKQRGAKISAEEFIARNPSVIVVGYDGDSGGSISNTTQALMAIPGAERLTAVREHHVIVFSNTYLLSRAVDGTKIMADQIATFK